MRRKHEDKLLDLPVLFHLPSERVHLELAIEDGHRSSEEQIRITFREAISIERGGETWCDGREGVHARRVLSHGNVLQPILQHLEQLFWELDALAPIAGGDVAEYVAYGGDRIGDRARDARRGVLAVLFARCVPVAVGGSAARRAAGGAAKGGAGGFGDDEVTQEPAVYTR